MSDKFSEQVIVRITRGARMKLKVLAALQAKSMSEYLEALIDQKENERLLGKSTYKVPTPKRVTKS